MSVCVKNFLITGRPGIGKTTAILRIVDRLSKMGIKAGGVVSREERSGGRRTGFILEDLVTRQRGYLAKAGVGSGPRVGRYVVFLDEIERVAVAAIINAVKTADVVIIDEIGPMELYSEPFKNAVVEALDSSRPVVATIHIRARERPFTRAILSRRDVRLYELTLSNRARIPGEVAEAVAALLGKS